MKKISIVIPVYNGEAFITECVSRLQAQTIDTFEVIFVDDGSTDGSGALLERESRSLKDAKVFHKKNGGVSSARNVGLTHATGAYVLFVDCDDRWTPDYVEKLYRCFEKSVELAICGYREITPEGRELFRFSPRASILSNDQVVRGSITRHHLQSALWNKMFSMDIIREKQLRFDESLAIGEDMLFLCQYCKDIQRAAVIQDCLYEYVKNPQGAMLASKRAQYFQEKWIDEWDAILAVEKEMGQAGMDGGAVLKIKKARIADKLLCYMERFGYQSPALRKELLRELRKGVVCAMQDPYLEKSKKRSIFLNAIHPGLRSKIKK